MEQLLEFPELFQILNMILPTCPYQEWAKAHNCDMVSASDAFLAVSKLLCAIAAFLLRDIFADTVETIPERCAVLLKSPSIVESEPKHARSVFGKLVHATNHFGDHLLPRAHVGMTRQFHEVNQLALKVFKAMGYSLYTWDA